MKKIKPPKQRSIEDYNFDELVTFCSQRLIEDILEGRKFKSAVFSLCDIAARWSAAQNK